MTEIFLPSFYLSRSLAPFSIYIALVPPKMRLYVVQAEPITIIMGSPEMFIGMYTNDLNNEQVQGMKIIQTQNFQ